jgi:hypothetical protein
MADRWLYIHAGAAHGPVDFEKLAQLAAQGKLWPADLVWRVGEDRGRAVEAHTLVKVESFPVSSPTTTQSVETTAPQAPAATPDWLVEVEAEQQRPPLTAGDADVVGPAGGEIEVAQVEEVGDVELVEQPKIAEPVAPKPSKPSKVPSRSHKKSAPAKKSASSVDEVEEDDDTDEEESGISFRRRDLVMLGLGMAGVGVAVAAGLFFAKLSQRKTEDEPPQPKNGPLPNSSSDD